MPVVYLPHDQVTRTRPVTLPGCFWAARAWIWFLGERPATRASGGKVHHVQFEHLGGMEAGR